MNKLKSPEGKDILKLRNKIAELDKLAQQDQISGQENIFEIYAELVNSITKLLSVEHFNFYIKSSAASPNLSGVLSIVSDDKTISLQYIKFPINNKTVAGYSCLNSLSLAIDDVSKPVANHENLEPELVWKIDKKINRKTKEALVVPIINSDDGEVVGVLEVTNSLGGDGLVTGAVEALQEITDIVTGSLNAGFFSLLLPSFLTLGKSRHNTTIVGSVVDDEDSLVEDDFVEENEDEKNSEEENEEEGDGKKDKKGTSYVDMVAQLKSDTKPDPEEYFPETDDEKYYDRFSYLVKKEYLDEQELHQCKLMAETEEKPVEPFLIIHYKIPLLEIGKAMAQYFKLPYIPYDPTLQKPESLLESTKVKTEFFQRSKFVPLLIDHKKQAVRVICTDPRALEASGVLRQVFSNVDYYLVVTTEIEFQYFFQLFFGESDASVMDDLLDKLSNQYGDGESDDYDPDNDQTGVSDNEMVVLVNKIISDAYARGVSDIHIEPYPGKAKTRVRFRIDGSLIEVLSLPSTVKDAISTRIKVMANLDISDRRRPQDGKIAMKKFSSLKIELRVATLPTSGGLEDVVMRILASGEPLPMAKLGVLPENEAKLIPLVEQPYGILFVCGPTGSGKTTTLHSILKHLNTPETKIWTAEDPVEITQIGLRQVQINVKAGLTFPAVMRSFLRADPDIIMVGEMRDHETVSIGVEASLTGHLVLSTLHTNSAPEAIVRLIDMGMDPFNFADALLGILAQRLAKSLCKCKEPYIASDEELDTFSVEFSQELLKTPAWKKDMQAEKAKLIKGWRERFGKKGELTLYKPKGCGSCDSTGYKGRMGLHELMVGTDRIKRLVQEKARVEELLTACLEEGMLTLKMDGMLKVLSGKTDMKQVRKVCVK